MENEELKKIESLQNQIDEAFQKAGVIDYFYVGITLEGYQMRNYCYGSERREVSNAIRYNSLLGAIESYKGKIIARGEGYLKDEED